MLSCEACLGCVFHCQLFYFSFLSGYSSWIFSGRNLHNNAVVALSYPELYKDVSHFKIILLV